LIIKTASSITSKEENNGCLPLKCNWWLYDDNSHNKLLSQELVRTEGTNRQYQM
jgi:hypothetical protein